MYTELRAILVATNRLPYTEMEARQVDEYIAMNRRKGLSTRVIPEDMGTSLASGILMINAPELMSDFLFIKINGGRGLFGGQKSSYLYYVGQSAMDSWMPGGSAKMLLIAVTGINNIYRSQGML